MRGEAGTKFKPDIFDDGSLAEQAMKKLKAFADVGNVEAMSKERCTAAGWQMGQPRIWPVNDFSKDKEPADRAPTEDTQFVSHDAFMKMLEVAWHKDSSPEHVEAILKRTVLIVNTVFLVCSASYRGSVPRPALADR